MDNSDAMMITMRGPNLNISKNYDASFLWRYARFFSYLLLWLEMDWLCSQTSMTPYLDVNWTLGSWSCIQNHMHKWIRLPLKKKIKKNHMHRCSPHRSHCRNSLLQLLEVILPEIGVSSTLRTAPPFKVKMYPYDHIPVMISLDGQTSHDVNHCQLLTVTSSSNRKGVSGLWITITHGIFSLIGPDISFPSITPARVY